MGIVRFHELQEAREAALVTRARSALPKLSENFPATSADSVPSVPTADRGEDVGQSLTRKN